MDHEDRVNRTIRMSERSFRLGSWLVEPELNRLARAGQLVQIEPRLMKLLVMLAERPGNVTLKGDIVDSVWGNRSVSDESLAKAVSKLRKILGDDPENPRYIETIRKSGYRLIADVAPDFDNVRRQKKLLVPVCILGAIAILALVYYGSQSEAPEPALVHSPLNAFPITSRPGRERDPNISNDGAYIVYSSSANDDSAQIFLHGIGRGTEDRQLTRRGENSAPVFSPDGDSIAFLRKEGNDCAVILLTLIDGAERVLGECSGNGYGDTAIAPEGRWLAFNARANEVDSHAIYLLDADTGRRRALTMPPDNIWGDYDPQFTADGRFVVFARSISEGMQDIFIMEIETGRERRITDEGRNVMGITLFGERVVYGTNRSGRYSIWSIGLDGEDRYQLPITSAGILNPSASADGSRLVVEALDRAVSLDAIDLTGTDHNETILSLNADILHPDLSPVNERIVFSANRSGFYEIWDSNVSGSDLRRLTGFSSGFTAHPKFSPDGSKIAFDARPGASAQIYVMDQDGSDLITVSDENRNAYAPTWSPDGLALYYAVETGETLQIWRTKIDTRQSVQITMEGGLFARVGTDGFLYHVRPNEDGIWRVPIDQSSRLEHLSNLPEFADWGNWALRRDRILFYDRQQNAIRAFFLDSGNFLDLAKIQGAVPPADPSVAFSFGDDRAYLGIMSRFDSDLEIVHIAATVSR